MQIDEEAAGNFCVTDEVAFEANNLVRFFVNPHDSSQFLDDAFHHRVGFVFRIRFEIEDEDVLAAKTFVTGIDELADAKEDFDARFVVFFIFLAFFLFLFFFRFLFFLLILNLFDAFFCFSVFFFLFLR